MLQRQPALEKAGRRSGRSFWMTAGDRSIQFCATAHSCQLWHRCSLLPQPLWALTSCCFPCPFILLVVQSLGNMCAAALILFCSIFLHGSGSSLPYVPTLSWSGPCNLHVVTCRDQPIMHFRNKHTALKGSHLSFIHSSDGYREPTVHLTCSMMSLGAK